MRNIHFAASLKAALRVVCLLPFAAALVFGQAQQVNLTAGPTTLTMPDGSVGADVGLQLQALATGTTSTATCAALNVGATGWSPVVITVPTGSRSSNQSARTISRSPTATAYRLR